MSTPEQNKALVRRFIDCLTAGDVAGAADCFDIERYYSHAHRADLAGTWEQMKARRRAAPLADFEGESEVLVADGDRVVRHVRASARHSGDLFGVEATDPRISLDLIEIWRIDGDKIVEHWGGDVEMDRLYNELTHGEQP